MDGQKEYEALATQALEAQRLREEGAVAMAAQIEEGIEKRLGEMVYANGWFPPTIRDVKETLEPYSTRLLHQETTAEKQPTTHPRPSSTYRPPSPPGELHRVGSRERNL